MSTLPTPKSRYPDVQVVHLRVYPDDVTHLEIIEKHLKSLGLHKHDASRNGAMRYALQIAADAIRNQK